MEWLERVNRSIEYIEQNLESDIDYSKAAKAACCSVYHYQRMFSFIADISLAEYIRRRRLTLAAFELQNSDIKVIDLSFKYGYDSPEAFTRAFRNLHGITPTEARELGSQLKAYPRISFRISIKGDVEMNYRIEEKPAFTVFGVEKIISAVGDQNYKEIPEFWKAEIEKGTPDRIAEAAGIHCDETYTGIMPVNAIMCYRDTGKNTFPYMLFAFSPEAGVPEGFTSVEVPALTWAVFNTQEHTEDKTSEVIQELWRRIYSEWFPTSNFEHVDGPELEMYGITKGGKSYCEVWIPVTRK